MDRPYISQELRRLVITRADHLCEYCLIHEQNTAFGCAVDHIISLKHSGSTNADNLAYACVFCNRFKGRRLLLHCDRLYNTDNLWWNDCGTDYTSTS